MEKIFKDQKMKYHIGKSVTFEKDVSNTKYNLAPRGFGRTSYRLAEIVQIGRIPVYLYDDYSWLSYEGTKLDISHFGYSGKKGSLRELVTDIKNCTEKCFTDKTNKLLEVREYYTLIGVIKQIEMFFKDPLGPEGGQLRCTRLSHPQTDH
jgi:hypothetical protein